MHKEAHDGLPSHHQAGIATKKDLADASTDAMDNKESMQDAQEREMFERAR